MSKNPMKYFIIGILLISFVIPYFEVSVNGSRGSSTEIPQYQSFSKEDYTSILEEKSQGLGNITLTDVAFNEKGFFNNSQLHPDLEDDLTTGSLNMTYMKTDYLETVSVAQYDNLDSSIPESKKIKILLNESVRIAYNHSIIGSEGYLIYGLRLSPVTIKEIYVQNQSIDPIIKLSEGQYSIDSANFLNFDYYDYFQIDQNNFSMYILYEYNLNIGQWILVQDPEEDFLLKQQEESFIPTFTYNFTISGSEYNKTLGEIIPAYNLKMNLELNLPDKDQLLGQSLWINDLEIEDFLNTDNVVNFSCYADYSEVKVQFNANFTIQFQDPVDYSWAIDRLVDLSDVRERIYFPKLISGPDHIFLENLYIFENTITIGQVTSNSSLFDRQVNVFDANVSIIQEALEKSLIFTKNSIKKKGLRVILPFIIKGETVPFTIKYKASNDLRLIITDGIHMPLTGMKIELYYFEKPYGTYISNELVQPMAPAFSDQNGEVLIKNVPNGNYHLKVFQNNQVLLETEVSALEDVNYITTDIFHFPIIIMIFSIIYGMILLIGLVIYLKNRRS
jgi:hypothetical protein